jgi:flagellar protein FliJ
MFNFRLQTILDVRKAIEDKILYEFSEQQKELHKETDHLQSIQQQKCSLIDKLRKMKGTTLNICEITLNTAGIKRCQNNEAIQKERVKAAVKKVDLKRELLLEATKKRKAMEILKTRQHEKHQSDSNLIERTEIDEMVIVRHNRRKQS